MDVRTALRRADDLLREERYAEAVDAYQAAADAYMEAGFALKALAVLRQIVEIADRSPSELRSARTRALMGLLRGYTSLGSTLEADAVRRLLD
jgi:hypothetical protein